ncbi:CBS domain-containing protein [Streptomyces sp. NBC_00687]|uniref:CBS domain-containing protein n=1 Tax=Streptomyces sp. NBC_00687 TaxID=2975807 RepID=UPI0022592433|nr:CBS domain-containing protein [Streptomyces sp. NBC_00687]MCX4913141.1 CBS domain-containing protein [Streptomyces sp. NBC_00687]
MERNPYRVGDVMTHAVVAVGRKALFKDILERMEKWQVSGLPVLEGDGRVIGLVSEADLLSKEVFRGRDADRLTRLRSVPELAKAEAVSAEELMSAPAVTVHAEATLAEAARVMALRHVKRLPVVNDEGVLEGVVSRGDLLKVFLRPDTELADEIKHSVVDAVGAAAPTGSVGVSVHDGVATLTGQMKDVTLIPLVARMAQGVEGVVKVDCRLTGM